KHVKRNARIERKFHYAHDEWHVAGQISDWPRSATEPQLDPSRPEARNAALSKSFPALRSAFSAQCVIPVRVDRTPPSAFLAFGTPLRGSTLRWNDRDGTI